MASLRGKILNVCITVPDVDEAMKWYSDILGFQSLFHTRNNNADGFLRVLGREEIELYARHLAGRSEISNDNIVLNIVEFVGNEDITNVNIKNDVAKI